MKTWNSASVGLCIVVFSLALTMDAKAQETCNATAAPDVSSLVPEGSYFFYVDVELLNGNVLTLGFEYDGDIWDFSEQYGSADDCSGQLNTFINYTLAILTSPSCAADQVYTPAEEALIEWYVFEVENFCQGYGPSWISSLGDDCRSHAQCDSGVCFDLQTCQSYWPWCFGHICTVTCEARDDEYCQDLARQAGAPHPERAYCAWAELLDYDGSTGHDVCDFIPAGLGTMGCE